MRKVNKIKIQKIREMYAGGKYFQEELAEIFKINKNTISLLVKDIVLSDEAKKIRNDRRKANLPKTKVDAEEAARLFLQENWTLEQLGERYSVSRERVRQILKREKGIALSSKRKTCIDCGSTNKTQKQQRCAECRRIRVNQLNNFRGKKQCKNCGGPCINTCKEMCRKCRAKRKEERFKIIEKLWCQGKKLREISEILGNSFGSVYQDTHRMRKLGYNLPRRNVAYMESV